MTENNNGIRKGRTEATLEGLAKSIDELKEISGLNCPIGKDHEKRMRSVEKRVIYVFVALSLITPGLLTLLFFWLRNGKA